MAGKQTSHYCLTRNTALTMQHAFPVLPFTALMANDWARAIRSGAPFQPVWQPRHSLKAAHHVS